MKRIVNDKSKYKTRATLGSSRVKPTKLSTGKKPKYREVFLVDENGYFSWKSNDSVRKKI